MRTSTLALHGESSGIVSRMPNNHEAGYGPAYVSDRGGPGWVFYVADCHWPSFYFIRCATFEEAYEHAEVVLCDIADEAEAEIAKLSPAEFMNGGKVESIISSWDASQAADGRVRTTWALQGFEVKTQTSEVMA